MITDDNFDYEAHEAASKGIDVEDEKPTPASAFSNKSESSSSNYQRSDHSDKRSDYSYFDKAIESISAPEEATAASEPATPEKEAPTEQEAPSSTPDFSASDTYSWLEEMTKRQPMIAQNLSDNFYKEENLFQGATPELDKMMSNDKRALARIQENNGDISNVVDYLKTIEDPDKQREEYANIGKQYYLANAGDIRAGLEIFSKTGDIVGNGTAEKISEAIQLLQSGNEEDAARADQLLDPKNVGVIENLKSALWKNNAANKTLIGLGASELVGLAAGKLIAKTAEVVTPKVIGKIVDTAVNGTGKSQQAATKIMSFLSKNKNVQKTYKNMEMWKHYDTLMKDEKAVQAIEKYRKAVERLKNTEATASQGPFSLLGGFAAEEDAAAVAAAAKEMENATSHIKALQNLKKMGVSIDDPLYTMTEDMIISATRNASKSGAKLDADYYADLVENMAETLRDPELASFFRKNVAGAIKEAVNSQQLTPAATAAAISEAMADELSKYGKAAAKVAVPAGVAAGAAGKASAGVVAPHVAEHQFNEAPTAVVQKLNASYQDNPDVDIKEEAGKLSEEMAPFVQTMDEVGNFKPRSEVKEQLVANQETTAKIIENAYEITGEEMSDTVKKIVEELHEGGGDKAIVKSVYEDNHRAEAIMAILASYHIPIVSSTAKAISNWMTGGWNSANVDLQEDYKDITNNLKAELAKGGLWNDIKALVNAAKEYKAATQYGKMYQSLKSTQKAVSETLLAAFGLSGASSTALGLLGLTSTVNLLKSLATIVGDENFEVDSISQEYEEAKSSDTKYSTPKMIQNWSQNGADRDYSGYNKGLEEVKQRKELPSDMLLKVYYKEPKTFARILEKIK